MYQTLSTKATVNSGSVDKRLLASMFNLTERGRSYHEYDAQHGQPASQVGGRLPLKVHPAVRCELEGYALDLPPLDREPGYIYTPPYNDNRYLWQNN